MQKAVVFEAAPAEERVEGVQGLLALHRLRAGPVDVGGALRGQHIRVRHLRELSVPMERTETATRVHFLPNSGRFTRLCVTEVS